MKSVFQAIRSSLLFIWLPVTTLVFGVLTILISLLDRKGIMPHLTARLWARLILWAAGVKVTVEGLEDIDPGRPCIYAANHQSQFDIPTLLAYLPVQFRWLAKKELFQIPLFGLAMRRAGYIPIDRSHPKEAIKSLEEAAQRIRAGTSVLIFPEGTRSADGRLLPFRLGGMALALKSKCPIVPLAICGSRNVLPRGTLWVRPGHIKMLIGQAIETTDFRPGQKNALAAELRQAIESLLARGEKIPPVGNKEAASS